MFEHDCDTDEDCEVYFLKPVNEYNIVDKIKEANKELFDGRGNSFDTGDGPGRKVTFHPNLEEYEPNPEEDDETSEKPEGLLNMATLNEEDETNGNDDDPSPRTVATIEECAERLALEVQKKIEAIEIKMSESVEEEDEIDEISEEILESEDLKTNTKVNEYLVEANAIKEDVPSEIIVAENINTTVISQEIDSDQEVPEEHEGDDNLSIIVASYLPQDIQIPCEEDESPSKTKTQTFKRKFSFRRKNSGRRNKCRSPEITNLKLNYKTCCEYRNSDCAKLPKYTGYMSEYGLSRDQLEKREQTLQIKHKVVVEKSLKATEAEVQKMQDNERAFTTWLKNKMRFPINRTKNMFDVKKTKSNNTVSNRGGVSRPKFCGSNKSGVL